MTFHVGQKVTLREDLSGGWYNLNALPARRSDVVCPEFGTVYRIREIDTDSDGSWLTFHEIRNKVYPQGEPSFDADLFRAVVEPKTDISVFTAMLNQKRREHSLCGND